MSGAPPLPPPPPPPPKSDGHKARRNQQMPPHESVTSIPPLDSAPPSGNIATTTNFSNAAQDATILNTISQLPPPPPPPPVRRALSPQRNPVSSSAASVSTTSTESTTFSSLPPPPNVTYATTSSSSPTKTSLSDLAASKDTPKMGDGNEAPPYLPILTFVADKKLDILARRQTHIPIVVVATESSHELAWKNNLQLSDMFQGIVHDFKPDGKPSQLPPFRSVNRSLNLKQVPIQFYLPEHLQPHSYTEAHDMLSDHAKLQDSDGNVAQELLLLEDRVDELLQDRDTDDTLEQVTREAYRLTSPLDIPWLLRYRYALDESTNHLQHDLISCPPVVLLVCTSNEVASPQDVLQELRESPHVLPEGFRNGLYDPNAIRYEVLVLHDAVDGPNNFGEQYLRQTLQNQFGPNSAVIRINSVNLETAKALSEQEDSDLWGGNGTKGNCLSFNDRSILGRYFQSLITSAVLPAMERRIATLNAIVSERKKGMRNLVKSFWRKPKEQQQQQMEQKKKIDKSASTAKYRYDSIESQARLLADTLFVMKDYEAALSTYRLVRDDFKSDKALAHYANVQEMMGMCMYHLDPYTRSRDIFAQFETALLGYTRAAEGERAKWGNDPSTRPQAAPHATRLASRLCLLIATASDALTRGRELEVADLLASASSHESSLGAAVLLEQASSFYFQAEMHRKYSFHMLMSGHMFRTAGQDNHAFRCFTSALYVYRHGSWNELHNHLRSALAAQLYSMGRMSIALILYAKLVGTSSGGKVSAKSQQKFLSHLLEICENHPKPALAGADRMAVPPKIPNNEREAFRNDQLERIVHVIRFTMGASRVLQLPYMNLPLIVDSSVRIWTHAEQHFVGDAKQGEERSAMDFFGTVSKGKESIWQELEIMSKAELNASDSTKPVLDETITSALSKVKDPKHRRVIAQVDKEKQNQSMIERSKRKGSIKPKPPKRAKGEPLFCDFQMKNPLGVEIFMTDVQLVARMVDGNGRVMTNQDAIEINKGKQGSSKTYTFASTEDMDFSIGDFCRFSEPDQKSCFPVNDNPFFVVTKRDMQLPPLADVTVSAGVCPLVEGDLEILGVRCKLFDKVWVYHPFDIEGPLLQDTRENISNRVRGESMLLKSKVEREMPCLTAELIKRGNDDFNTIQADGGPLLEGQVSPWTIRLRNVGNAPASNVTLKTNLPWINAVNTENHLLTAEEQEAQATSRCVGPTGTLMSLPMTCETLKETGRLHPGEDVDIPIQLRTSGTGKEGFYMLFGYDLWSPMGDVKCHRWLRQMYEVPVYASLDLSAKVKAAFWNANEQILSVELTNNRTDRPTDLFVTLDKLSVASRHYKLEAVPGQFITSEENGNVLQIGWQERVTIHYKVIPLAEESKVCLLSECSFTEMAKSTTIEAVYSKATDYLCLENARDSFEAAWKAHQIEIAKAESATDGDQQHPRSIASIRRAKSSSDHDLGGDGSLEAQPTSIGQLCSHENSLSKIHLMCSWRAILGQEVIRGEHHLRGIPVRPISFFNGCPIVATASHQPSVVHDFTNGPVGLPVKLTLRNQLLESAVNLSLAVKDNTTFELIGFNVVRLSFQPQEEKTIPLEALISRAGVHNLQAFDLTVKREEEEEFFYPLKQQWIVTVTDTI
mmetsp:Transcript_22289/g.55070  ORF Transcript_22289/g.55070 Transcript_22289/m.55070 type:complete len:1626 (+) Transcript_22289:223-5100(+)